RGLGRCGFIRRATTGAAAMTSKLSHDQMPAPTKGLRACRGSICLAGLVPAVATILIGLSIGLGRSGGIPEPKMILTSKGHGVNHVFCATQDKRLLAASWWPTHNPKVKHQVNAELSAWNITEKQKERAISSD